MRRTVPTILTLALLLSLAALVGCGNKGGNSGSAGGGGPGGADSPEALVAKVRGLVEKEDFAGVINLMAPEERPLMSMGILMVSKMAPMMMGGLAGGLGGDEAKAEIATKMKPVEDAMAAALAKHHMDKIDMEAAGTSLMGGTPEDAAKWMKEQAPGLDHGAFVADVMGAMSKLGDDAAGQATKKFKSLGGELENLKIDGDKATGTIGGEPAEFVKVAGRWYLSIKNQMGGR